MSSLNPGDNLGIWLAMFAISVGVAGWNISRLWVVRPAFDRLLAFLGGAAILAVVIGTSVVITEVTECRFAASSPGCSASHIALVALTDVAIGAALITWWLRSEVCRVSVRTR